MNTSALVSAIEKAINTKVEPEVIEHYEDYIQRSFKLKMEALIDHLQMSGLE